MKNRIVVALILGLMFLASAGFAQTGRIDKRQKTQRVRINDGRKEGEITKGEAVLLNREQRKIKRVEHRAMLDGRITPREKARIDRMQVRASRQIRHATNNSIDKN